MASAEQRHRVARSGIGPLSSMAGPPSHTITPPLAALVASLAAPALADPIAWPDLPRMQLERQYPGPLKDTLIQRWRDPVDGVVCYIYLPSGPALAGSIGSISCMAGPREPTVAAPISPPVAPVPPKHAAKPPHGLKPLPARNPALSMAHAAAFPTGTDLPSPVAEPVMRSAVQAVAASIAWPSPPSPPRPIPERTAPPPAMGGPYVPLSARWPD